MNKYNKPAISKLTMFLVIQVSVATLCFLYGYNTIGYALLALATLDVLMNVYKHLQASFTPSMRLVEVTNKGGDIVYQSQTKSKLLGGWSTACIHANKGWAITRGQEELVKVLEAAVADEKAKVVTTRVVPHDDK